MRMIVTPCGPPFCLLVPREISSHNHHSPAIRGDPMASVTSATSTAVSTGYKYIQFDASTFVARIVLNQPPYNVLSVPMMKEIATAIEGLSSRNDIKAVLITSSAPKM